MTERRETERRRVCLGGLLRVAAFLPAIDCTLRDVSLGGARIRIAPGTALPGRFELSVPCRGETRPARVVWRDRDGAGIRFEADEGAEALRDLDESRGEADRLRVALLSGGAARTSLPQ